jgi:signal transduction protein with GAF and PtsI domain
LQNFILKKSFRKEDYMPVQEIQFLKLFKDVCKKINSSLDIKEVLNSITENTVKALNVKGCTIFLLDQIEKKLKISSTNGLSEAYMNKGPVDSEKSIVETLSGKWVLIPDATNDHRIQYPIEAKKEGIITILSVPMFVKEKIIGVLRIYTSELREFSDVEKEFISGLAEIGSIGIENARMYTILKTDHEKLIYDVHKWFDYGEVNRP